MASWPGIFSFVKPETTQPLHSPFNSLAVPQSHPMKQSLINAMAGPSSGKAGLARDQSEINRIIAEASKNSKFFQEAKRKDEMLTERIGKLLVERDNIMSTIDISSAEAAVDKMISDIEATRDVSKVICHVDLDAFYASVESLDNPSLVGKAFGVSGGVLSTASYEARRYGCRSGMATFIAKKLCPHLIVVPLHFERYAEKSKEVMDILAKYDPDMCIMGADEAYLTLNDYCDLHNMSPEECVEQMREEVLREAQLSCSAGIAANRMLAKICSDCNKPNGQYSLPRNAEDIIKFMNDLPVRKIPGIGRVTERILTSLDVNTCGDVYKGRAMLLGMEKHLAGGISYLLGAYLGIRSNVVEPHSREERKSIGVETTFNPRGGREALLAKLEKLAKDLEEDLARTQWAGRTLVLKYKLDTYQTFTRTKTLQRYITSKADIYAAGKELFLKEFPSISRLRLIGLRLTTLKDLRPRGGGIDKFIVSSPNSRKRRRLSDEYDLKSSNMGTAEPEDMLASPFGAERGLEDGHMSWVPGNAADTSTVSFPSRWSRRTQEEEAMLSRNSIDKSSTHSKAGGHTQSLAPTEPLPFSMTRLRDAVTDDEVRRLGKPPSSITTGPKVAPQPSVQPRANTTSHPEAPLMPLQCPICDKELAIDNEGLNAHIDYCLSRGTIMEAASGR